MPGYSLRLRGDYPQGCLSESAPGKPAFRDRALDQEDGRDRWIKAVDKVSRAFALAVPLDGAIALRDEVSYYQTIKAAW